MFTIWKRLFFSPLLKFASNCWCVYRNSTHQMKRKVCILIKKKKRRISIRCSIDVSVAPSPQNSYVFVLRCCYSLFFGNKPKPVSRCGADNIRLSLLCRFFYSFIFLNKAIVVCQKKHCISKPHGIWVQHGPFKSRSCFTSFASAEKKESSSQFQLRWISPMIWLLECSKKMIIWSILSENWRCSSWPDQ